MWLVDRVAPYQGDSGLMSETANDMLVFESSIPAIGMVDSLFFYLRVSGSLLMRVSSRIALNSCPALALSPSAHP